ncbi:MAG: tRNA (N(6)-L-threonylcarbamoyladenosine(37)-C(2))-methylthiotransferase MtaB [Deltaproteobacteria bacterium]
MSDPTVITMGCRLNAHESDVAAAHARAAGLRGLVVVNTCAVTSEAVRQAAQMVRRVRRDRPEARIMVTGCAAELEPARFAAIAGVDAVIGSAEKLDRETYVSLARANDQLVKTGNASSRPAVARPAPGAAPRTRAILAVQNGCDHRCTFCIIPFARGPSRSMPVQEAVESVRRYVAAGHREVVLTGVDLTSYGTEADGIPALGRLVRSILRGVPALARLRLSSIDPAEVDAELIGCFAEEERLMPHLHLSLQSGDDIILKRMKRRHSRNDAIRFTERLRSVRPGIVFGADLIAGFPTETEEAFENTLRTIDACGLTYLHIFPYSPRPGTPAVRMPQLPREIVMARAARLREEARNRLNVFLSSEVGQVRDVLVERGGTGRTRRYAEVVLQGQPEAGSILDVKIIGHDGARLIGEPVSIGSGVRPAG